MKLSLLILSTWAFAFSNLANASDNGLFMVVKGTVKVLSAKDQKESSAKVGTKVFSGDTVITENDSRAKIVMSDRNVLQLSPNSRFEITKYKTGATEDQREVQVALMQGKVRVQVEQKYGEKNKFELRTPTAVAGVRGTQYVAQFEPQSQTTTIVVLTGKVAVSTPRQNANAVVLTPNMGSTIKEDTTQIEPVRMSADDIKGFTGEAPPAKKNSGESSEGEQRGGPEKETENKKDKEVKKEDKKGSENSKDGANNAGPATNTTAPDKSLVTSDIVGGEALSNDSKLQSTMQQKPPTASPATASPAVPVVNVPKPPATNPLVNEAIQNKNSKTKVILTPRPQQ